MVRASFAGKSILIVEDDPQLRRLLEVYVGRICGRVIACSSLELGRRQITDSPSPIDLLITDVRLPDGDGLELAREFLSDSPGSHAIVSSGMPLEFAQSDMAAGRLHQLEKPYTPRELISLLERILLHCPDEAAQA